MCQQCHTDLSGYQARSRYYKNWFSNNTLKLSILSPFDVLNLDKFFHLSWSFLHRSILISRKLFPVEPRFFTIELRVSLVRPALPRIPLFVGWFLIIPSVLGLSVIIFKVFVVCVIDLLIVTWCRVWLFGLLKRLLLVVLIISVLFLGFSAVLRRLLACFHFILFVTNRSDIFTSFCSLLV